MSLHLLRRGLAYLIGAPALGTEVNETAFAKADRLPPMWADSEITLNELIAQLGANDSEVDRKARFTAEGGIAPPTPVH